MLSLTHPTLILYFIKRQTAILQQPTTMKLIHIIIATTHDIFNH
ncbi:MAG: hypothetical protein QXJ63_03220 [Candidatus Bathyarchaeia archaeon]